MMLILFFFIVGLLFEGQEVEVEVERHRRTAGELIVLFLLLCRSMMVFCLVWFG